MRLSSEFTVYEKQLPGIGSRSGPKAYNAAGKESLPSNEISFSVSRSASANLSP
jgi:hypothetical protein